MPKREMGEPSGPAAAAAPPVTDLHSRWGGVTAGASSLPLRNEMRSYFRSSLPTQRGTTACLLWLEEHAEMFGGKT